MADGWKSLLKGCPFAPNLRLTRRWSAHCVATGLPGGALGGKSERTLNWQGKGGQGSLSSQAKLQNGGLPKQLVSYLRWRNTRPKVGVAEGVEAAWRRKWAALLSPRIHLPHHWAPGQHQAFLGWVQSRARLWFPRRHQSTSVRGMLTEPNQRSMSKLRELGPTSPRMGQVVWFSDTRKLSLLIRHAFHVFAVPRAKESPSSSWRAFVNSPK